VYIFVLGGLYTSTHISITLFFL